MLLLIEMGDATALEVVEGAGRRIGLAIANVITLLNPEMLVICGEGTAFGPTFIDPIVSAVREQTFADVGRHVDIRIQSGATRPGPSGPRPKCSASRSACPGADESSEAIWHRVSV